MAELENDQTSLTFVQYLPPGEVVAASAGWHEIVGERLTSYVENGKVPEDPNRFSELKLVYETAGIK